MLYNYGVKEIVSATDELDARALLESYTPDLILLDINHSNWLEFCSSLRKDNESSSRIPIIAFTDMDKNDDRVKMLSISVSEIIHKPVQENKLQECLNLYLQKNHLMKRLLSSEEPTDLDLLIARNIQYTLLPTEELLEACKENYNIKIHHIYQASQALGGDYWMVRQLENSRLMVCVADFAGHGVSVAIDTFRLHNYLGEFVDYSLSPAEILKEMNDNFYRMMPAGQYLTCFLGIIDTSQNILTYSGAAMPPAILSHQGKTTALDCSGTPVGAYAKADYANNIVAFAEKSILLVYSDGLVEINNDNKTLFTKDSLLKQVNSWSSSGSQSVYDGIVNKIKETGHHFDDDLTVVLLEF
jgi:sigma-B regulation protein RsbU (phosphoserine phosphatase)